MKKTTSFIAVIIAIACTMIASCEKATQYQKPTVTGIKLSPNPCAPGDTVKASLVYAVAGDCWYWWSQKFSTPTSPFGEYQGTCNEPSHIYFIAPDTEGEYPVRFKGQITITSGKNLWGDAYELSENLIVE